MVANDWCVHDAPCCLCGVEPVLALEWLLVVCTCV